MNLIRLFYFSYFTAAISILQFNHGVYNQFNSFFIRLFLTIYLLLELLNFSLKKLDLKADVKLALSLYLPWTVIATLVLTVQPGLRNLAVNRFGHFMGGFISALLAWDILASLFKREQTKLPAWAFHLLVLCLASTVGVFNEIVELFLDTFFGTHTLGPRPDTAIDLFLNTVGIVVVLFFKKTKLQLSQFLSKSTL